MLQILVTHTEQEENVMDDILFNFVSSLEILVTCTSDCH